MKYGIVSSGDRAYHRINAYKRSTLFREIDDNNSQKMWKDMLHRQGYAVLDCEPGVDELFQLMHDAFEWKFDVKLDIQFDEKYLASIDGLRPIPHNQGARIFSTKSIVYVDDLMISILFEYITASYLWSRFGKSIPVYSFCFYYITNNLNRCCRQGLLNSDKYKSDLLRVLEQNCTNENDKAFEFISDMYWCILAFAISHEIAHIYLGHTSVTRRLTKQENWDEEYEADAVGYGVYLDLIDGKIPGLTSPTFLPAFHDYLYAAPMILFLFYGDLYYMGYWAFNDTIGDSHPALESRIDRLIKISEDDRYQFDTEEGNAVLSAFWDVSDTFRTELFYKLKNGKLEEFIRGSYNIMGENYEAAKSFDESMCRDIRDYAEQNGLDANKMVGLYDTSVRIDVETAGRGVVYASNDKVYSTKPFNIFFTTRRVMTAILDIGLSISPSESKVQTVILALSIFYRLCQAATVEITEEQAQLLIACHEHGAYEGKGKSIDEEVLQRDYHVSVETEDKLCKMGCIVIREGRISLLEEVRIKGDAFKSGSHVI